MSKDLKDCLKNIEKELDILYDNYSKIQENRKKQGLSLAIYKAEDELALELRKINEDINKKEKELEELNDLRKHIELEEFKEKCIIEHEKFKENRFLIFFPKEKKTLYIKDSKEVDQYIENCIQNKENIKVLEYIEYNNTINKDVNMPLLIPIFELDYDLDFKVVQFPHQGNYTPYMKEISEISTNKVLTKSMIGYNNKNEEIFTYTLNSNMYEKVCIHNPFSSSDYILIERFKNCDYYVKNNAYTNYTSVKMEVLDKKYQDLVDKTLKYLENCKEYNYDIKYLKKFLS